MSKNEVAEKKNTSVAVYDYGEHAGKGFENQDSSFVRVPFLKLLQSNTEVVAEGDAKAGQIMNTVTGEIVDGDVGFKFIPLEVTRSYIEWLPDNGGFVGEHAVNSKVVQDARENAAGKYELFTEKGNELVETFTLKVALADGTACIIAFSGTKIKVFQTWNTKIKTLMIDGGNGRRINPPMFANMCCLKSELQTNAKGQKYYNFVVEPAEGTLKESLLNPQEELFQAVLDVRETFQSEEGTYDYNAVKGESSGSSNTTQKEDIKDAEQKLGF